MSRPTICLIAVAVVGLFLAPEARSQPSDGARRTLDTANGLLNRGLYELAIPEYEGFLRVHGGHAEANTARYALGVCHYRQAEFERALGVLDDIRVGGGFEYGAETGLIRADCLFQLGRSEEAARALERLLERYGDHAVAPDAAALMVESLNRAGRHRECVESFRGTLARWPNHTGRDRIELFGAMSLVEMGLWGDALIVLDGLVGRGPGASIMGPARMLLAQSLHRVDRVGEAIVRYREVIDGGPEESRAEAMVGLAQLLRARGDEDEARRVLEEMIGRYGTSPASPRAHLEFTQIHFEGGRFEESQRHARTVLASDEKPLHAAAAYWMAKSSLRLGRAEAAAQELETALAAYPGSDLRAPMTYDLGVARSRAGDSAGASATFRSFRVQFKDHALSPNALQAEASLALERERLDEARRLARSFMERYASHELAPSAVFVLGEAAYLDGDFADAARAYEALLGMEAEGERARMARYRLGMSLYRAGHHEQARPHLEGVTRERPIDERLRGAMAALGDIAFDAGDWSNAEEWYGLFVGSGSPKVDDAGALLKLGLALLRQDRHEEALERFEEVIELSSDHAYTTQASFERGQALMALARNDEAARAFRALVESGGDSRFGVHAMRHLGTLAMGRGDLESAERWFARAARTGGSGVALEARYDRARALLDLGSSQEALGQVDAILAERDASSDLRARARAARAVALVRLGRYEAALGVIDGLSVDGMDAETWRTLSYERASCLRALEREDEALAAYRAILAEDQEDAVRAHAMLELAELEMERGAYGEAAVLLDGLVGSARIEVGEDLLEPARYRRGVCSHRMEDHAGVFAVLGGFRADFAESTLADSADLLCADALIRLGRRRDALVHLERCTVVGVSDDVRAPALLRLGELQGDLQAWNESERRYAEYLESYPASEHWFRARFGLGWSLENQGRHESAIEAYRGVVDRHTGETAARAQFQIGECLFAQGQHEHAARELLRVEILYAYPEWSAASLYEAGRCFEALNKLGEAREQYRRVIAAYGESKWSELAAERLEVLRRGALPGRGTE